MKENQISLSEHSPLHVALVAFEGAGGRVGAPLCRFQSRVCSR